MISQVDEQEAAMVTDAMNPARHTGSLADIFLSQFATGVAAVGMHYFDSLAGH